MSTFSFINLKGYDKEWRSLAAHACRYKDKIPFTLYTINLQKKTIWYISFTGGFSDQFGGPNGKKFKYKQLQELLLSISKESMEIQKQKLDNIFESWKGNLDQVDDVCLIGILVLLKLEINKRLHLPTH